MEASTHTFRTSGAPTVREIHGCETARLPQLGLTATILVWAAAALPMGLLAWLVAPAVAEQLSGAGTLPRALVVTLTAGLAWQFVLVLALVWREQGSVRWPVLRSALWLNSPRSPRTGRVGGRVWLVTLPLIAAFAITAMIPIPVVDDRDLGTFLSSNSGEAVLNGSWGWLAVVFALVVFNTVLGEELLFRGYLLPRMNGVFGDRDWIANGVLFALYHLHTPWVIPTALLDALILSYPSKRYRSALIGIVVHSAQSVVILALVLSLVAGG